MGCTQKVNNIRDNEITKIFIGYKIKQDTEVIKGNNSYMVYFINIEDLNNGEYERRIIKKIEGYGYTLNGRFNDTDVFCTKDNKKGIFIARPAYKDELIKESIGVMQESKTWNIGFISSESGAMYCADHQPW